MTADYVLRWLNILLGTKKKCQWAKCNGMQMEKWCSEDLGYCGG